MDLLNKVLQFGVLPSMHYRERRQVLVSNHISFILAGAALLIVLLREVVFHVHPIDELKWLTLFLLVPTVLNRLSFTIAARVILCVVPIIAVWYIFSSEMKQVGTIPFSMFDGIRIYLIALSILPYLVFDRSRVAMLALCLAPSLVSIIFYDEVVRALHLKLPESFDNTDYKLLTLRTFVAYVIVNSACYTLLAIVAKNDELNEALIKELHQKSEHIKIQNAELKKNRQELLKVNQDLERLVDEKTRDIKRQNQVLSNYAFTNAHKLRGPVARILGLINVSRLDIELNYSWVFTKVEEETKDIDRVIKSISERLDEAHQPMKENDRQHRVVMHDNH